MNRTRKMELLDSARRRLEAMSDSELAALVQGESGRRVRKLIEQVRKDGLGGYVERCQRRLLGHIDGNDESSVCLLLAFDIIYPNLRARTPDERTFGHSDPCTLSVVTVDPENGMSDVQAAAAPLRQQRLTTARRETLEGSLDNLSPKNMEVARALSLMVADEHQRAAFVDKVVRAESSDFNWSKLKEALAEIHVEADRKTIKRAVQALRGIYMTRQRTLGEAVAGQMAVLAVCHEHLLENDRNPELRRLAGYSVIPMVRADTKSAFQKMYGVDTIAPRVERGVDVDEAADILLDFLRAYVSDEAELDPMEDLAFVLADRSSPYLRAIAGARAAYALLGSRTFGGVFVMHSLGILAYDLLSPQEYSDFFSRVRQQLQQLNRAEAAKDAAEFDLPGLHYALNAAAFNIATRYHDWAMELIADREDVNRQLDEAWEMISSYKLDAGEEAHYAELLAEHAGVALRAGRAEASTQAWRIIKELGREPVEVLEGLARLQSSSALVTAAIDAAVDAGVVTAPI